MSRLRDYQTFVAVVETGSLSAAANQLHRSVSAISKQLSRFESDLGASLVQRSTHALTVTEAGYAFFYRCKAILDDIADAEASLVEDIETVTGTLRLSFPEVLINSGLFELFAHFNKHYPGIRFDLKVSNKIENLEVQRLDAAIRIADLPDSRLTAVKLGQSPMRICATPEYLKRRGTPRNLNELTEQHQLLIPEFVNVSEQLRRLFPDGERPYIDIAKAHRIDSESALFAAMQSGLGIGFVLDIAARHAIEQDNLVTLLPEVYLPTQPIYLVFRQANPLPARLKAFKTFLVSHFRS